MNQDFNSSGGLKREYEDDGGGGENGGEMKRFKRGEGPKTELRVLLLSKNAGAIIGVKGSNIQRLRSEYTQSVMVPDSPGPERILTISSDLGTVCDCIRDVIPTLEEYKHFKGRTDFDCEVRMLIHTSRVGGIIGRAGFKIKELRQSTGANIKVFSDCCPRSSDRVVAVQGNLDNVVNGISAILDTIKDSPVKGKDMPYDPSMQFDNDFPVSGYGGFSMMDGPRSRGGRGGGGGYRGGGGGRGGPRSGGFGGRSGGDSFHDRGMGGGRGGRMGGRGRMNDDFGGGGRGDRGGNFGGGRSGGRDFGGDMGGGFDGPMGGGGFQQNFANDAAMGDIQGMAFGNQPQMKDQVTIPKDCAGSIIGKGGERIRSIRARTGAGIIIDEALPGSNDRVITITGTDQQIRQAKIRLKQAATEKQGGPY